ncbi:MAG: phosphatase PAP2 family protein [Paludibacteraceae bacterium]
MKKLLKQNSTFLGLCLLLIVVLSIAVGSVPKGELHLTLCLFESHTPLLDAFFRCYTQVGEWVPYVVCFLLLFYRLGWTAFTTSCVLLSGAVTQVLKRLVDAPRPLTWFAAHYPDVQLPLADGVEMSRYFSFPSGHTTTFFAFFFALSIIVSQCDSRMPRRSVVQTLFFLFAALGGYSRLYLSQHFAADVLGGMVIGLLITGLLYLLFARWENKKWWKMHFFAKKR